MRKNDLISILQEIEGNPEVVLWNGFVEDYMHLDRPVQGTLYKMKRDVYEKFLTVERAERGRSAIITEQDRKKYSEIPYEYFECNPEFEGAKERMYKKKNVIWITTKNRNKKLWDRNGGYEY